MSLINYLLGKFIQTSIYKKKLYLKQKSRSLTIKFGFDETRRDETTDDNGCYIINVIVSILDSEELGKVMIVNYEHSNFLSTPLQSTMGNSKCYNIFIYINNIYLLHLMMFIYLYFIGRFVIIYKIFFILIKINVVLLSQLYDNNCLILFIL